MGKRMSNDEFINRSVKIHGNKYDYSKVNYVNSRTKVEIICPIHGSFIQNPRLHLSGSGCPKCGIIKQKKTILKKYGVDNVSKSESIQKKREATNLKRYGHKASLCNEEIRKKISKTNLEKYGVEYIGASKDIRKKIENTLISRYGTSNLMEIDSVKEKIKKTNLKKYGFEYVLQSPEVQEKIRDSVLEKYGVDHISKSEKVQNKRKKTNLEKYGVEYIGANPKIIDKIRDSKIKNNTMGYSKSEDKMYDFLCEIFGKDDVIRQYISKDYPYSCDFYIISRDLYIELNALWVHGDHWFNNDKNDREIISDWKDVGSDYYLNAIDVWTKRDVDKRLCAKKNNLNYLVFWDTFLRDFKLWVSLNCPNGKDWDKMYSYFPERDISDVSHNIKLTGTSRNLSIIAKIYQLKEFYKEEINLWNDNKVYRTLILQQYLYYNRFKYLNKSPKDLTNIELLRGFKIAGIVKGYSSFDTTLMNDFVKKYHINSIYDPCAGWGERLLYCKNNNIKYLGVDINLSLKDGYDNLIKDFNIKEQSIIYKDSSQYKNKTSFNCVFTCPPYYNTEIYSKDGAENMKYKSFLNWWKNLIDSSINSYTKYFCFQINQKYKDDMSEILRDKGYIQIDEFKLSIKANHFNKNTKREFESLLVFELIN